MTREEAIKYIKSRCIGSTEERDGTQWSEAMWTAIEALSEQKTGEWIKSNLLPNGWHCSHCDSPIMTDDIEEMLFCPNCGARMKGADDE